MGLWFSIIVIILNVWHGIEFSFACIYKKVNRKVQRVPQPEATANPWQEGDRKRKRKTINACEMNKQMHEKHID